MASKLTRRLQMVAALSAASMVAVVGWHNSGRTRRVLTIPGFLVYDSATDSLRSLQRSYTNGRVYVQVIPMVHIARRNFYDTVLEDLRREDALVLEELVIPRSSLFSHKLLEQLSNHGEAAVDFKIGGDVLRLFYKKAARAYDDVLREAVKMGRQPLGEAQGKLSPDIVQQHYLTTLMHEYCRWTHADVAPESGEIARAFSSPLAFRHLNQTREHKLFAVLDTLVHNPPEARKRLVWKNGDETDGKRGPNDEWEGSWRESNTIAIPWGAAHCPAIAEHLTALGFTAADMVEEREVMTGRDMDALFGTSLSKVSRWENEDY